MLRMCCACLMMNKNIFLGLWNGKGRETIVTYDVIGTSDALDACTCPKFTRRLVKYLLLIRRDRKCWCG